MGHFDTQVDMLMGKKKRFPAICFIKGGEEQLSALRVLRAEPESGEERDPIAFPGKALQDHELYTQDIGYFVINLELES